MEFFTKFISFKISEKKFSGQIGFRLSKKNSFNENGNSEISRRNTSLFSVWSSFYSSKKSLIAKIIIFSFKFLEVLQNRHERYNFNYYWGRGKFSRRKQENMEKKGIGFKEVVVVKGPETNSRSLSLARNQPNHHCLNSVFIKCTNFSMIFNNFIFSMFTLLFFENQKKKFWRELFRKNSSYNKKKLQNKLEKEKREKKFVIKAKIICI